MKKRLTHNLGLKILALMCAIGLWLIAVNINDPVSQRVYTVGVQFENLSMLTNAGKYVEMVDGSETVRVTVRASRSVFSDFSEKNIIATADIAELTEDNMIPLHITASKIDSKIESIKADKDYVAISIEDVMKIQKRISVNVQNQPADGYMLGNISTDQNAVIVSGPASVVGQIASTAVEINVDGATNDVNITLPVHLYDSDGQEIADDRLTKSISEVFTTASILQKKEVALEYVTAGEPADGYLFAGEFIKEPATVIIAGKAGTVKNVTAIMVTEPIDLDGKEQDVSDTYELKEYLPEGVILADGQTNGVVTVTARIEKESTKKIKINEDNISLINVPDGYKASIRGMKEEVEIALVGLESQMTDLTTLNVYGTVDISQLASDEDPTVLVTGNHYIVPDFALPEYVSLDSDIKIHILLEKE